MGGDGGTKAVNRNYLRGAGSATTTADAARNGSNVVDTALAEEEAARSLRTCAVTNEPLDFDRPIVACPYGKLYQKEAAIEALLKRKDNVHQLLGDHIRGLKDLNTVVFEVKNGKPVCPVTGRELGGSKVPAFALLPGKDGEVNVVSQYAIHQLGEKELFQEYSAKRKLRLVPPPEKLELIQADFMAKRRSKKKSKKGSRGEDDGEKNGAADRHVVVAEPQAKRHRGV